GIGYSFFTAPKNVEDVEAILKAEEAHHGGHHAEAAHHDDAAHSDVHAKEDHSAHTAEEHDAHAAHAEGAHADHHAHDAEHHEHLEHVLHQLQNKPWAAVYVAALFFMLISLGALA